MKQTLKQTCEKFLTTHSSPNNFKDLSVTESGRVFYWHIFTRTNEADALLLALAWSEEHQMFILRLLEDGGCGSLRQNPACACVSA